MSDLVAHWTPQQIDDHVSAGGSVLVDVRADWCRQCKPQEQALQRVAPDFSDRVSIGTVDAGAHPDFIEKWGINALPTFLTFRRGEHRDTLTGYKRAPELRDILSDLAEQED